MGKGIAFIYGNSVGYTIPRVQYNTSGTTGGIKGQHSLNGYIHGGHGEGLKHDLRHLFTVGLRVEGSLCQEGGRFFRSNTEFVVEGVVPDFLHVIPVSYNS